MKKTILLLVFSFAAGLLNGFLGTGGGILLVFLFSLVYDGNRRDLFADTVLTVFFLSLVSALLYAKAGMIDLSFSATFFVPGVIGGVCGALLLEKIDLPLLKKLFAAMVIFCGVRMVLR